MNIWNRELLYAEGNADFSWFDLGEGDILSLKKFGWGMVDRNVSLKKNLAEGQDDRNMASWDIVAIWQMTGTSWVHKTLGGRSDSVSLSLFPAVNKGWNVMPVSHAKKSTSFREDNISLLRNLFCLTEIGYCHLDIL